MIHILIRVLYAASGGEVEPVLIPILKNVLDDETLGNQDICNSILMRSPWRNDADILGL